MAEREAAHGGVASDTLLVVDGVEVEFKGPEGWINVLDDVGLSVRRSEAVGIIGESGCGKSVTARAILGLIRPPQGRVAKGRVIFEGRDLIPLAERDMSDIRGNEIAMVFQEPLSSMDPAFTVGQQLVEVLRRHQPISRREARARAIQLLSDVGIADAKLRIDDHPHQLSGGMLQRSLIAMALSCEPRLVIADEPTTALDVTVQAQVLELLQRLQASREMALLLVTHDLGVVAQVCERVIVMYAGQVVEVGGVDEVFATPQHPYTAALIGCQPGLHLDRELEPIPGTVPARHDLPDGCLFAPRCAHATEACQAQRPPLREVGGREVRCHLAEELDLRGALQ